jgi:hypothetical protein
MAIYTYTDNFASVFNVGKKYATTISEHLRTGSLGGCAYCDKKQSRKQKGKIKIFGISKIAAL